MNHDMTSQSQTKENEEENEEEWSNVDSDHSSLEFALVGPPPCERSNGVATPTGIWSVVDDATSDTLPDGTSSACVAVDDDSIISDSVLLTLLVDLENKLSISPSESQSDQDSYRYDSDSSYMDDDCESVSTLSSASHSQEEENEEECNQDDAYDEYTCSDADDAKPFENIDKKEDTPLDKSSERIESATTHVQEGELNNEDTDKLDTILARCKECLPVLSSLSDDAASDARCREMEFCVILESIITCIETTTADPGVVLYALKTSQELGHVIYELLHQDSVYQWDLCVISYLTLLRFIKTLCQNKEYISFLQFDLWQEPEEQGTCNIVALLCTLNDVASAYVLQEQENNSEETCQDVMLVCNEIIATCQQVAVAIAEDPVNYKERSQQLPILFSLL